MPGGLRAGPHRHLPPPTGQACPWLPELVTRRERPAAQGEAGLLRACQLFQTAADSNRGPDRKPDLRQPWWPLVLSQL